MKPDRFLNDDKPLKVTFKGKVRWASWQEDGRDVHVHSAYGSRRRRYYGTTTEGAKKVAEYMFLDILTEANQ